MDRKERQSQSVAESRLQQSAWSRWWPAIGAAGLLVVASCGPRDAAPEPARPPRADRTADDADRTAPPAPASKKPATPVRLDRLIGQWNRAGEPYILEIKRIESDGKAEATYSNPNPIRVARAEVSADEVGAKVFVELRDANYPGCTYRLRYDAERDVLKGAYFQAMMGETYDVEFVRLPASK